MRDLNDMGFRHVYYMPLATDPGLFNNAPADAWARQLAFVGKSMSEQALEAWEKLRPFPHIVNAMFDAFDEGRVTRERFAHGIAAILGGELVSTLDRRERRHVELCLIYEATRRQRAAMVLRLDPLGIEVYGDLEWRSVCRRARPTIGYHDGLAPFYRSTAVNVNNTSLQMASAVNQRVFDCPASGGFLITDAQEDLNDLFAQDSLVTYSNLDELEAKTRHYLTHPEERRVIVARARTEILARHTHTHRLKALAQYLREIYR
jgi:spore maturation protein CgeB